MSGNEIKGLATYWLVVVVVLFVALALHSGVLQVIALAGLLGAAISTYMTWRSSRGRESTP